MLFPFTPQWALYPWAGPLLGLWSDWRAPRVSCAPALGAGSHQGPSWGGWGRGWVSVLVPPLTHLHFFCACGDGSRVAGERPGCGGVCLTHALPYPCAPLCAHRWAFYCLLSWLQRGQGLNLCGEGQAIVLYQSYHWWGVGFGGQKRLSAPPKAPHFASLLGKLLRSALLGSSSAAAAAHHCPVSLGCGLETW